MSSLWKIREDFDRRLNGAVDDTGSVIPLEKSFIIACGIFQMSYLSCNPQLQSFGWIVLWIFGITLLIFSADNPIWHIFVLSKASKTIVGHIVRKVFSFFSDSFLHNSKYSTIFNSLIVRIICRLRQVNPKLLPRQARPAVQVIGPNH